MPEQPHPCWIAPRYIHLKYFQIEIKFSNFSSSNHNNVVYYSIRLKSLKLEVMNEISRSYHMFRDTFLRICGSCKENFEDATQNIFFLFHYNHELFLG